MKHTIDKGSAKPIQLPLRRVPFHKRQEVHHQVVKCLKHTQIIEPSDSPWSSLVVLVAKPDLLRGYWQIDVAEQDREKTAFATPDSLYQFCKLNFGHTNARVCLMRAMHLTLKGLCWSDCLGYIDDNGRSNEQK